MPEFSDIRKNKLIIKVISTMIGIPFIVYFFLTTPKLSDVPDPEPFDTTSVIGYHFYTDKGVLVNQESNIILLNELYKWMGTPHRSKAGRNGLDCSGLVKLVYQEVFDIKYTGSSADIYRISNPIDSVDIKEGDLIFFRIESTRINHVGIYLNNGRFVHSSSIAGVTINHLDENYYRKYFYKVARPHF